MTDPKPLTDCGECGRHCSPYCPRLPVCRECFEKVASRQIRERMRSLFFPQQSGKRTERKSVRTSPR